MSLTPRKQILRGRSHCSSVNSIYRLLSASVFPPPPSSFLISPACFTLSCRHVRQVDNDTESRLWLIPLLCLALAVPLHPSIGSRVVNITWAFSTCVCLPFVWFSNVQLTVMLTNAVQLRRMRCVATTGPYQSAPAPPPLHSLQSSRSIFVDISYAQHTFFKTHTQVKSGFVI
jgi:hypothetical protein